MPLTQSEIGDHLGMSQQQVSSWLDRLGLSVDHDLATIRLRYIEALREAAAGVTPSAEREAGHRARRQLLELRYLRESGALTSASEVEKAARDTARTVRDAMLGIPDRLAQVLDPAHPQRAHKLLTAEIQSALRALLLQHLLPE